MTGAEWDEIMQWVASRFPNNKWKPEQAVAYATDLRGFDVTDVWTGLYAVYEAGTGFAPNGSQLVAAARKAQRQTALDARYDGRYALPGGPLNTDETHTFDEWVTRRFGESMTAVELIRRIHVESGPCKSSVCDLH